MTGIVPQHDRLWTELSAYEHIRLFATLKNQGSKENITRILKKVYLEKDKFQASGEYSGGMKRRLSIAIASVGDAKIIYMDEPTTGIDPLVSLFVFRVMMKVSFCFFNSNNHFVIQIHRTVAAYGT